MTIRESSMPRFATGGSEPLLRDDEARDGRSSSASSSWNPFMSSGSGAMGAGALIAAFGGGATGWASGTGFAGAGFAAMGAAGGGTGAAGAAPAEGIGAIAAHLGHFIFLPANVSLTF